MQARDKKKFLVTDYDNTAFSARSSHPDKLSEPIIKLALENDYDGFYACTHRAYSEIDLSKKVAVYWGTWKGYDAEAIKQTFPTHVITTNFEKVTHLPNQAVSTLDDILYPTCGIAYRDILQPYEKFGTLVPPGLQYVPRKNVLMNATSKNKQLLQVAQHAAENNPDSIIVLDYVDDVKTLCNTAKTAEKADGWPQNVHLNIYHYNQGKIIPLQISYREEEDIFYDATDNDMPSPDQDVFYDALDCAPANTHDSFVINSIFGSFQPAPKQDEQPTNFLTPTPNPSWKPAQLPAMIGTLQLNPAHTGP